MCVQLFSCPLCARPSFESLDSLRIGLVSVATRPLLCPVCNETLLGIDKLTIHLFGHTINIHESARKLTNIECNGEKTTKMQWNSTNLQAVTMKNCANENSGNSHLENVSKNPTPRTEFNDGFLQQPNLKELKQCQQATSARACDNTSNVADIKLMTILNSNLVPSQDPTIHVNHQQNHEGISKTWTKNILLDGDTQDSTIKSKSSTMNMKSIILSDNVMVSSKLDDKVQKLTLHIPETCHNSSALKADECQGENSKNSDESQRFQQSRTLRTSKSKEKTERCNICGLHFSDHNILMLHKQLAHMIAKKDLNVQPEVLFENYPCHLCPKVFQIRGCLMVHMRVAHTGYNLGSLSKDKDVDQSCSATGFNCPTCGKNFRKEQHVTQHLKTHEGKQWACDVCSKMFTTKYFLKKHKRLHSGEMPYKCNICSKTFTFQQSYHKHRLYHKDDKPHTCTTCGRSFKELSTLHNHERIHTGEKPFVCETCGKCFRQRVSYLVHRRIHTGVMPYTCTACGRSFRYKVSQRTHKCPGQSIESVASSSANRAGPEAEGTILELADLTTESVANANFLPFGMHTENKYVLVVHNDQLLGQQDSNSKHLDLIGQPAVISVKQNPSTTINNNVPNDSPLLGMQQDLSTLVMPPSSKDLSLPSSEMKQLRLSSPTNEEEFIEPTEELIENSNLQKDIKHAIDGILYEGNQRNNHPEKIHEESLEQLLDSLGKEI